MLVFYFLKSSKNQKHSFQKEKKKPPYLKKKTQTYSIPSPPGQKKTIFRRARKKNQYKFPALFAFQKNYPTSLCSAKKLSLAFMMGGSRTGKFLCCGHHSFFRARKKFQFNPGTSPQNIRTVFSQITQRFFPGGFLFIKVQRGAKLGGLREKGFTVFGGLTARSFFLSSFVSPPLKVYG